MLMCARWGSEKWDKILGNVKVALCGLFTTLSPAKRLRGVTGGEFLVIQKSSFVGQNQIAASRNALH